MSAPHTDIVGEQRPMGILGRLYDDRRGGAALAFAVSLTVMIGFGGLATEVGAWLLTRRAMQGAADAAAVSAVSATAHGGPDITTQAKGVAAQNNWPDGVRGITVTVNRPPTLGNYTGDAQAVEVIIAQNQSLLFSALLPGVTVAPTVRARGVAAPSPSTGNGCLLGLATGNSVQINGNGAMTLSGGCDIDGNGNIDFNGNHSTAHAHSIDIHGTVSSPSQLTLTNGPGTQNDPGALLTDPNSLTLSPAGTCSNFSGTFTAGATYCSVSISGGNVTIPSGIYYIRGGGFSISNGTVTSASGGVTIVMMGTAAAPTVAGQVTINGQANVNLTGIVANEGLIFYEDPRATAGGTDTIAGNGTVTLTGTVDLRNDTVDLGGNGSVSSPTCLHVIGLNVVDTGNATLSGNCSNTGVTNIGQAGVARLVE